MAWRRPLNRLLLATALFGLAGASHAEPSRYHNRDDEERAVLRTGAPHASDLLEHAEALLAAGKLDEAEPLLAEAAKAVPDSFVLARRRCQVLTELGRRSSAIEECNRALKAGHMAMDRLASVSALMTGPNPPTTRDVAQAVLLATTAKNLTGQPFGDAALCEIAYRLGDAQMLRDCTTELARIAPGHYLTRRYAALVDQVSLRFWGAWALLGLAVAGTGVHAWRRRRGARRAVTAVAVAATLIGYVLLSPQDAAAAEGAAPVAAAAVSAAVPEAAASATPQPKKQKSDGHWQLSRFPIDHENPEAKIPTEEERNKEPLDFGYFLQDLASEGAYAEKKGDYAEAVKYWRALAKAVPDTASGFRRACRAYEHLKDRVHGLDYCGSTLNLQGAELEDYTHYGSMMLMKPTALDQAELSDFENTIQHLREQPTDGAKFVAETLSCELGVAQEDVKRLEGCTQALEKMKPGQPQTLSFEWSLAMFQHDYSAASELTGRLKDANYNAVLVARMEASAQSESRLWKRFTNDWRYQAGVIVALLGALGFWLSRRKPATPTAPPSAAPGVT